MKWNFFCPLCSKPHSIDWSDRKSLKLCKTNGNAYIPPTPSIQPSAYVDTHEWPIEIETIVIMLKGENCTVPGCDAVSDTLDHRSSFSKSGKTSVDNLWPMCSEHNQSKSDADYTDWLSTLKSRDIIV